MERNVREPGGIKGNLSARIGPDTRPPRKPGVYSSCVNAIALQLKTRQRKSVAKTTAVWSLELCPTAHNRTEFLLSRRLAFFVFGSSGLYLLAPTRIKLHQLAEKKSTAKRNPFRQRQRVLSNPTITNCALPYSLELGARSFSRYHYLSSHVAPD